MSAITIIGQGPAALLAASFIQEVQQDCVIVADSEGSLPLWSGSFDFHAPSDDISNPWSLLDRQPLMLPAETWAFLWESLVRFERAAGIPVAADIPSHNWWTITCTGKSKPVFVVPQWQYVQKTFLPVWFIGFQGLADSMADFQCHTYQQQTGVQAGFHVLPNPAPWTPSWGPIRWASYLDTDEGLSWLVSEIQNVAPEIPKTWPILLPQVIGRRRAEHNLQALTTALGQMVFEYPLVTPSLGGMRIRDRWVWYLKKQGVPFLTGRATSVEKGRVTLADGRQWHSDHVIVATGGILGGGLEVMVDGRLRDPLRDTVVGRIPPGRAIDLYSWGQAADYGTPEMTACGSQCGGWDPNQDGNGGAMILATVWQSLCRTGIFSNLGSCNSERSVTHVGK
ncbi:MAG: hypothetical protein C7B44_11820 [Sulfobacillus thermosulfidooxidans]|nr:MAG: hypothetical protein C7B44_11820 [Sulfobacillus thermosulfidooxidans]